MECGVRGAGPTLLGLGLPVSNEGLSALTPGRSLGPGQLLSGLFHTPGWVCDFLFVNTLPPHLAAGPQLGWSPALCVCACACVCVCVVSWWHRLPGHEWPAQDSRVLVCRYLGRVLEQAQVSLCCQLPVLSSHSFTQPIPRPMSLRRGAKPAPHLRCTFLACGYCGGSLLGTARIPQLPFDPAELTGSESQAQM